MSSQFRIHSVRIFRLKLKHFGFSDMIHSLTIEIHLSMRMAQKKMLNKKSLQVYDLIVKLHSFSKKKTHDVWKRIILWNVVTTNGIERDTRNWAEINDMQLSLFFSLCAACAQLLLTYFLLLFTEKHLSSTWRLNWRAYTFMHVATTLTWAELRSIVGLYYMPVPNNTLAIVAVVIRLVIFFLRNIHALADI